MADIEEKISPLIENQFPEFYRTDGPNFVAFVKAYYEWIEQNHQLLELEDSTNFNVGDTIQQANSTGSIVAKLPNGDILVRVNGLDTFKCYNVCSELIIVTSSSGGNTYIRRGGTARRLGPLFMSRNLLNIRDIDTTMELFIVNFKEKYLKNIEFDVQTNKQLLIKHSLDLFRAKGTERATDLFFRLVYGVAAKVNYPGEQVFKLSEGTWFKPYYLEITPSDITVQLVGKQITGVTSRATAFVEKYIKRKIKDGFVYMLYLSNVRGEFINDELLRSDIIYLNSPKVVGSLSKVEVITGSSDFRPGDVVSFNSTKGDYGFARVESVSDTTGVVDFIFVDGGYGYTISSNSALSTEELSQRTQSIISEKVLTLANVISTNTIGSITISNGGSGYANTDNVKVLSPFANAAGTLVTDPSGAITDVVLSNTGSGFLVNTAPVLITNSTGGATLGAGANLQAITEPSGKYFEYFEILTEPSATVVYDTATNNQLFAVGDLVRIGNSTVNNAFAVVMSNANNTLANANGELSLAIQNNGSFGTGNTIYLVSNASVTANIALITNTTASGTIMGLPNTATLSVTTISGGVFERGDEVYQLNALNEEVGNAAVSFVATSTTAGTVYVDKLKGVLYRGRTLRVRNKAVTANITNVSLTVGVYDINNTFSNTTGPQVFSYQTGTVANLVSISTGTGASFRVGTISDAETIYINTDLLKANNDPVAGANQAFMTVPLNAVAYGFPKAPAGNSSSIIFSCLNFDNFTIGTIGSLAAINPGNDYNVDPYILAEQPFIAGFGLRDYIIKVANVSGQFSVGERILQTNTTLTYYNLVVSDETGYVVGEKVYQGTPGSETATGIVTSIIESANTIVVNDVTGTFANSTALGSYITPALSATVIDVTTESVTSTAKGIIKDATSDTLYVKRIQFDSLFSVGQQITGSQSGTTAEIVNIFDDMDTLPIGLNAQISANVITANGTITSLEVIDSGAGYSNSEIMIYTSEDGERSGEVKAIVEGVGVGSGYYKTSKGFLSSTSFLHDGDYYQEYSYEILSRIPFEKYAEMYKRVLHTSGSRLFGGVLIEDVVDTVMTYGDTDVSITVNETVQFNSNTDVVSNAIVFDNTSGNNLIFTTGQKVTYYTHSGNTTIAPLANNTNYYVANASTTSIKLVTNPRTFGYSFNANTNVGADYISITRHNFVNNDVVLYTTSEGNTAITGLSNNTQYHIVGANSSSVKLAASRGGTPITLTPSSVSETGHQLFISTINITANTTASGEATNGHFIAHVYEN